MAELLKNIFNYETLTDIGQRINNEYTPFNTSLFVETVMDDTWTKLELKARARHITHILRTMLPSDYREALKILEIACAGVPAAFFVPDFIEVYGMDDWDVSVEALGHNTQYWSSEFAVRPFIEKDEARMMAQMYAWSHHESEHYRRLASEGCRPLLPWASVLRKFKEDPSPILPILETLKEDSSLYVRKSVANNINDISKNHPDLVLSLMNTWKGKDKHTDWIIKHGSRTLLKKGNREALKLFGYHDAESIEVANLRLSHHELSIGEAFSFEFTVKSKNDTRVRIEYGIDYMKANGKQNRKIFQLTETTFAKNQVKNYIKNHAFADLTTRKHYPGEHRLALIVNGVEQDSVIFKLNK